VVALRIASGVPSYTDDKVILSIPVDRESVSRWRKVDGSTGSIVLIVVGVTAARERVLRAQSKVIGTTLLKIGGGLRRGSGNRYSNGREPEGEGREGHHDGGNDSQDSIEMR